MFRKSILAASAFLAAAATASAADLPTKKAPAVAEPAPFFFVNDNSISIWYIPNATDPGVPGSFAKKVIGFNHFDVWAYGTNFFTINAFKSTHQDPASPCTNPPGTGPTGCAGATEVYGLFRSTLGFNQMFNTKQFSYGILKNVSFEVGADMNTENTVLAPAKKDIVVGLAFDFDLPYKGFFQISPLFYKEWNHNAFLGLPYTPGTLVPDGNTNFNGTWALEMVYSMPLGFLPESVPLTFRGRAAFYGPKGTGVPSGQPNPPTPTTTEFNSEQRLVLDVGKMVGGQARSGFFDVFVGWRYWQNKFGLNHSKDPVCTTSHGSCTENSASMGVNIKF